MVPTVGLATTGGSMTRLVLVALTVSSSILLSQIPIPASLIDATTVYMQGVGIERKWLEHAAKEVAKIGRWEVVADPDHADVILTLAVGNFDGGTLIMPITGVGAIAVPMNSLVFQLVVQESGTEEVLWNDSRAVVWTRGGAVAGLVEDVFKRIKEATRFPGIRRTSTGWRVSVDYCGRQYSRPFPSDTTVHTMMQWQKNERVRLESSTVCPA